MRIVLFASAALIGFSMPALAQPAYAPPPQPGDTGMAPPPAPAPSPPADNGMAPPADTSAAPPSDMGAPPPPSAAPETPPPTPPVRHHRYHPAMQTGEGGENWAHQPGTGVSGPASAHASNIGMGDTHSEIAPHFASPDLGPNADPDGYLHAAQEALARNQTGEAQQALEMAETRLLDRSTPVGTAGRPDQSPRVQAVSQALQALGRHDRAGAQNAIQMAMRSPPG